LQRLANAIQIKVKGRRKRIAITQPSSNRLRSGDLTMSLSL
jgi:hypothetical protein